MNPLFLSYLAAFAFAFLLVVVCGQILKAFAQSHERQWDQILRVSDSRLDAFLGFLKQFLLEKGLRYYSIAKMHTQLKRNLVRANYQQSADEYLASTLVQGVMILLIGIVICFVLFGPFSILLPIIITLIWCFWIRPSIVETDGEKRSRAVYRRIPYALDLSVLVLQTGGTLGEALEVISVHDDPLAEELRTALKEMDSGASQAVALKNMSDRVGLEPLESIVLAINRGMETGAPMAQTLTTQAELFRERRLQEVEKLAVEAPTKMTFPNMMVMLSVLLIIIGPLIKKMSGSGLL